MPPPPTAGHKNPALTQTLTVANFDQDKRPRRRFAGVSVVGQMSGHVTDLSRRYRGTAVRLIRTGFAISSRTAIEAARRLRAHGQQSVFPCSRRRRV